MPALSTARQNLLVLVVLLLGQLFLASSSVTGAGGSTLESWLLSLSRPVVASARALAGVLDGLLTSGVEVLEARRRNVGLEGEMRRMTTELRHYRETELENERLRQLLGMRQELIPESIAATVVTANLGRQTKMFVIDRGEADGVGKDRAVVTWGGAVGRVVIAERQYCKVRLLTDAGSGVAGVVQRSRAQGIVVGRPDGALVMLYVPRFSDVMHGDRIVTSGLDGVFPRGFGIGRVSSIHEAPDGTLTIDVAPELDYRRIEEVLVVLGEPAAEGILDRFSEETDG